MKEWWIMLVNSKEMLGNAKMGKYAVPQFNINNLEWTRYILEKCEQLKNSVILGVSEGALNYMGGANVVVAMVNALVKDLNITIPVCLHLDHGTTFDIVKETIDAGFTSVMIDASRYELDENIRITKEVVDYAHRFNVTVEAEVGHVGGVEDNISATNLNATPEEAKRMVNETGIDSLAPAVGTAHGVYKGIPKLDFDLMHLLDNELPIPLVLHGGSGIPDEDIRHAINSGINKININTELQQSWYSGVVEFINNNPGAFDPRKVIGAGKKNLYEAVQTKVKLFLNR